MALAAEAGDLLAEYRRAANAESDQLTQSPEHRIVNHESPNHQITQSKMQEMRGRAERKK